MVGDVSRYLARQYLVTYDVGNKCWKIVNLMHPAMMGVSLDDDIPDDSPALTTLGEVAVKELIDEMERLGMLGSEEDGGGVQFKDIQTGVQTHTEEERQSRRAIEAILEAMKTKDNPEIVEMGINGILRSIGKEGMK